MGSIPNASTRAARPDPERLERLGLAAGAVERDHQLAAQALVERMLAHETFELGHELGAAAELELCIEALLRDGQAELAQALDDRPRERLECEIGERLTPPDAERLPVEADGRRGVAGRERRSRCLRSPFEDRQVEPLRRHQDAIAGRPGLDERTGLARRTIRLQQGSQLRDLPVHLGHGGDRRLLAVQLVREAVDRHDPIRVEQQDRQHRALPRTAKSNRPGRRHHLERPQDAEGERQAADGSASAPR